MCFLVILLIVVLIEFSIYVLRLLWNQLMWLLMTNDFTGISREDEDIYLTDEVESQLQKDNVT